MVQVDESFGVAYYNDRPGIRTGCGVLVFDKQGDVLLVKPNYRNTWMWPGGGWEPGESPLQSAVREYTEELGVQPGRLKAAFVNYIPPRADGSKDVIHFVYAAEPVEDGYTETLTLQDDELDDVTFVPIANLDKYMEIQSTGTKDIPSKQDRWGYAVFGRRASCLAAGYPPPPAATRCPRVNEHRNDPSVDGAPRWTPPASRRATKGPCRR